jgi:hypothetical protein
VAFNGHKFAPGKEADEGIDVVLLDRIHSAQVHHVVTAVIEDDLPGGIGKRYTEAPPLDMTMENKSHNIRQSWRV